MHDEKLNKKLTEENNVTNKNGNTSVNAGKNSDDERKKDKRWLWIVLIILLLLLSFRLGSCYRNIQQDVDPTFSVGLGGSDVPTIDPNAGEYVDPETSTAPQSGVAIPGWGTITIPANQKDDIPIDFYNPDANKDRYYLTFEIRLPKEDGDGYEVLYKSGLIEAGLHIQNISLTRVLEKGEYDIIIHVQPYRVSDKAATNNADMKTKLIVK